MQLPDAGEGLPSVDYPERVIVPTLSGNATWDSGTQATTYTTSISQTGAARYDVFPMDNFLVRWVLMFDSTMGTLRARWGDQSYWYELTITAAGSVTLTGRDETLATFVNLPGVSTSVTMAAPGVETVCVLRLRVNADTGAHVLTFRYGNATVFTHTMSHMDGIAAFDKAFWTFTGTTPLGVLPSRDGDSPPGNTATIRTRQLEINNVERRAAFQWIEGGMRAADVTASNVRTSNAIVTGALFTAAAQSPLLVAGPEVRVVPATSNSIGQSTRVTMQSSGFGDGSANFVDVGVAGQGNFDNPGYLQTRGGGVANGAPPFIVFIGSNQERARFTNAGMTVTGMLGVSGQLSSAVTTFSSNAAAFASNAGAFGSNAGAIALQIASNAGAFGSNAGVFGSNAGAFGSNAGAFGSNAAVWASNAGAFGSNAGAFGSNAGVWASNAGAFGSNTATSAQQTASAAQATATSAQQTASAAQATAVWTSNTIVNSTFASNAVGAAQFALSNGGVSTSNAFLAERLRFPNDLRNNRVVLWEATSDNQNQFYGLGLNGGTLRYQVHDQGASHRWFGGTGATTSAEIMRCSVNDGLVVNNTVTAPSVRVGSTIAFTTATDFTLNENWGVRYSGGVNHPLKVAGASLSVGYDVANSNHGVGNGYFSGVVGVGTRQLLAGSALQVAGRATCSNVDVQNHLFSPQATFSNAAGLGQITVGGVLGHVTIKGSNIGFGPIIESGPNADIGLNFVGGCNAARGGAFRSHGYLRINQHGCIGIHEAIPRAIHGVQWNQTLTNRKIVLFDAAPAFPFSITDFGNDHEFYGLGVQSFEQRYQVGPLGRHVFAAAVNDSSSTEIMRMNHNRTVSIGNAGSTYGLAVASPADTPSAVATFLRGGDTLMNVTMFNTPQFNPSPTAAVLQVGRDTSTNRSISAAGGVGANGLDYAEYWRKSDPDVVHAKGDVVGVDSTGRLTCRWDAALHFVIKSTDPGLVGGDCWSAGLAAGPEFELARRGVDRIALCGRVPCNVQGEWSVGDYIVPQPGPSNTIQAACVAQQYMMFDSMLRCVGRIVEAGDDGRPIVLVRAV